MNYHINDEGHLHLFVHILRMIIREIKLKWLAQMRILINHSQLKESGITGSQIKICSVATEPNRTGISNQNNEL